MTAVMIILLVQSLLGGADNLLHHELQARLPARTSARGELALHAAREAIYAVVFLVLAWTVPGGLWAWALAALLLVELAITAADFLEEDRTRHLPPAERVLHLVLAVSYGIFLAALAPHLAEWLAAPTALAPASYGLLSLALTVVGIGVGAWSLRNAIAVFTLRPPAAPAPATPAAGETTLVTGGTGFIGSALVAALVADGGRVIVLTRDRRQARSQLGSRVVAIDRLDDLPTETRIDAIVDLAGAPVLGPPWTARRRRLLHRSRTGVTSALVDLVARLETKPRVLVTASAVGFYGFGDDTQLDETAPGQPIFPSELCRAREEAAARVAAWGVRPVMLRFGIVLGRGGGVLPPMALASRLGLGAVLGDGRQAMPWIHLADAIALIRFAIAADALSGAVNATAPETPRQAEFARALASAVHRPLWLRVPARALRLLLGSQSQLLLRGLVVVPARALAAGYRFRHPGLAAALADLFPGTAPAAGGNVARARPLYGCPMLKEDDHEIPSNHCCRRGRDVDRGPGVRPVAISLLRRQRE